MDGGNLSKQGDGTESQQARGNITKPRGQRAEKGDHKGPRMVLLRPSSKQSRPKHRGMEAKSDQKPAEEEEEVENLNGPYAWPKPQSGEDAQRNKATEGNDKHVNSQPPIQCRRRRRGRGLDKGEAEDEEEDEEGEDSDSGAGQRRPSWNHPFGSGHGTPLEDNTTMNHMFSMGVAP